MNEHLTPRQYLDAFMLEAISGQPLERRALLYRAFAAEARDIAIKHAANALADECDAIERSHRQLVLDFTRRNAA